MTTRTRISFSVYGTEFCRALAAVALFQAAPKDFEHYAAVRCLARHDGLSLAALNGSSAAVGHVDTDEVEGVGPFSIPHSQVKAVLAVFKRKLPKHVQANEYVLEVTVTERQITIKDVSVLFDGDSLTVAVPDEDQTLEYGDKSEADRVLESFAAISRGLDNDPPSDLTAGMYFAPAEVARIARAAIALGYELHWRPVGRRLIAPLAEDFVAYIAATLREHENDKPPFIDERALISWRDRLEDVVDRGVI